MAEATDYHDLMNKRPEKVAVKCESHSAATAYCQHHFPSDACMKLVHTAAIDDEATHSAHFWHAQIRKSWARPHVGILGSILFYIQA